MEQKDLGKSSLGMDANVAALLSYLLGFITGIIFYVLEKENKFVRFHAMQSIIVFGFLFVVGMVAFVVPFIGPFISVLANLAGLVLWVILTIKAYQGEKFKLPVAGDIAEQKA
ncbi:MAG: DUF4870 domain-containing protein [Candidatus Omnitrophota bacterium]|jgi:uncharacterized membrane protein